MKFFYSIKPHLLKYWGFILTIIDPKTIFIAGYYRHHDVAA